MEVKKWRLMFTGLVREFATVRSFSGEKLIIKSSYKPSIGDSIAINGACLTVVEVAWGGFTVVLSHESQKILATENYRGKVHMESAMKLSDRLEGHIVQGHIDCVGEISQIHKTSESYDYVIKVPSEFMKFIVPKGSIAVDGISLTINEVFTDSFRLTIIPHTLEQTLFGSYKTKRRVNIETDMFARYIHHMLSHGEAKLTWSDVDKMQGMY
jgi:riboflavin synthase